MPLTLNDQHSLRSQTFGSALPASPSEADKALSFGGWQRLGTTSGSRTHWLHRGKDLCCTAYEWRDEYRTTFTVASEHLLLILMTVLMEEHNYALHDRELELKARSWAAKLGYGPVMEQEAAA